MKPLPFEVSIDYPLFKSEQGLYFIGQTPIIDGHCKNALALLCNPCDSRSLIYVNAITITNISEKRLACEFYLGLDLDHGNTSHLVACTNTAFCPPTVPYGTIKFFTPPTPRPCKGVSIFSRIVAPQSTLVVDGGQIILGERQSLGVYIGGFEPVPFEGVRIAFGWAERDLCSYE